MLLFYILFGKDQRFSAVFFFFLSCVFFYCEPMISYIELIIGQGSLASLGVWGLNILIMSEV